MPIGLNPGDSRPAADAGASSGPDAARAGTRPPAAGEARGVRQIYRHAADDYDGVADLMSLGTGRWYRRQALRRAGLAPGMRVADVGFGTGQVAEQAIRIIGDPGLLIGIDPSPGMMRASPLAGSVMLVGAVAESIPLPDACVDFVSMGYALRHVGDLGMAFREFHRILKPGGRICALEITRPESRLGAAALRGYMRTWVPLLARLTGSARAGTDIWRVWRYYWDSVDACVRPADILDLLRTAGFNELHREVELGCLSEYHGRKCE